MRLRVCVCVYMCVFKCIAGMREQPNLRDAWQRKMRNDELRREDTRRRTPIVDVMNSTGQLLMSGDLVLGSISPLVDTLAASHVVFVFSLSAH